MLTTKNGMAIGKKYDISNDAKLQVNGFIYSKGENYTGGAVKNLPSGTDGRDYWNHLNNGIYWSGSIANIENLPADYGWIWKIGLTGNGDFNVLFFTQPSGKIYRKSGNVNAVTEWLAIAPDDEGIQAKPITLYLNTSGSMGSITLSQSAANFNYLEIFFENNQSNLSRSIRVMTPNGKNIAIESIEPDASNVATYLRTAFYNISGTSITYKYATYTVLKNNGAVQVNRNQNSKIIKVLGWS